MSQSKLNWAGILFWGAIVGGLGVTLFWQKDNIIGWLQNPQLPNFSTIGKAFTIENITAFIKDYGFLITGATTAITFVYGFYQKHQASVANIAKIDAEQASTQIELAANSKIAEAQATANSYKIQYETLQQSITGDGSLLREAQTLVSTKEEEIKKLRYQRENLQEQLETEIQNRPVITKVIVK